MNWMPVPNSSAPFSALRPSQGSTPAWAVRPVKVMRSMLTAAVRSMPVAFIGPGCQASAASRSSNRPSRAI